MKILENFLCGKKNNPEICEDGLVITDQLIAVIDGVTAKGKQLWNGKSSGCFAKNILVNYLSQGVADLNALELLTNLNSLLAKQIHSVSENLSLADYPRASIIIYNNVYKQIWAYGDCQCMINHKLYTHIKKIDQLNSDLRALRLEYELLQGFSLEELSHNDPGRAYIQDNLLIQFSFENKSVPFGYPVLNGMGIEDSMLKCYPVSDGDIIVLATDGYPILYDTLAESEKALTEIQEKDPLCFRQFRSTKGLQKGNISFDDRCYCRFLV